MDYKSSTNSHLIWCHNRQFEKYWKHRDVVQKWFERNEQFYSGFNYFTSYTGFYNLFNHPFYSQFFQSNMQINNQLENDKPAEITNSKKRKLEKNKSSKKKKSKDLKKKISEEPEVQITDELLEFLRKSRQYRKERDKKLKEENKETSYVNLGEVNSGKTKASSEAPTEQAGISRTREMLLLYGDGAPMIHGMETAMQLNFNRKCDMFSSKPWPYLPLNIKFS